MFGEMVGLPSLQDYADFESVAELFIITSDGSYDHEENTGRAFDVWTCDL